jgi:hypothetical protein
LENHQKPKPKPKNQQNLVGISFRKKIVRNPNNLKKMNTSGNSVSVGNLEYKQIFCGIDP